jgi:hypothetical protein
VPSLTPVPAHVLDRYVGRYTVRRSANAGDRQGAFPATTVAGIGVRLESVSGSIAIYSVLSGMPAERAGLRADDVIAAIDGEGLTAGLSVERASEKLRGAAGTPVAVKVARQGTLIEVRMMREVLPQPSGAQIRVRLRDGKLHVSAEGLGPVLDIEKGKAAPLRHIGDNLFRVEGNDGTRLLFVADPAGAISSVTLNPGSWEITADRVR